MIKCKEREKLKNRRIFGLFRQLLKPLLTALVLCCTAIPAKSVCWAPNAQYYGSDGSKQNLEGTITVDSQTPALLVIYNATIKNQNALEVTFEPSSSATAGPAFILAAKGIFWVDWGNGTILRINNTDGSPKLYYSGVPITNTTTVKIYSQTVSGYNTTYAAISFSMHSRCNIASPNSGSVYVMNGLKLCDGVSNTISKVDGYLGSVFPTVSSPSSGLQSQPRFTGSFAGLELTQLPGANFFSGLSGTPATWQFALMFAYNNFSGNLQNQKNWFSGFTRGAAYMFFNMFATTQTTEIHDKCFTF